MHKRKSFVIISIVIVIVAGICLFLLDQRTYSATDILKNDNYNPDFNVENPTVTINRLDLDAEVAFAEIKIPEETQQELIKAFKNAKFEKRTIHPFDYDYRMIISLNTGYPLYLISDKKSLTIIRHNGQYEHYEMVKDSYFFSILEKVTK